MKNKLLILLLGLSLVLTACGGKKPAENKTDDPDKVAGTEVKDNTEKPDTTDGTENPDETTDPTETEGEETDGEEETVSPEEQEAAKSREEQVNLLIKNSDYISIVKKTQTGTTGSDMQVLEDFKGSLKSIEFPEVKGIDANKEYLVFFRDSDTGFIILTDEATGLHEITATNDPVLEQVRETFAVEEAPTEDNNSGNQNNG